MSAAAQRAVELFRTAVPKAARPAAPVIPIGASQRRPVAVNGWVEQYQARVRMARLYLEGIGLAVQRQHDGGRIAAWLVTGHKHPLGNDELILLAMNRGMA